MLTKNQINEYNENGLLILRNFLNVKEVNDIRNKAKSIFGIQIEKNKIEYNINDEVSFNNALFELFNIAYNDFLGAAKAVQHTLIMHKLASSDEILSLLNSIGLKEPIICVKPIIYFNSPKLAKIEGHYKTPIHQDWRSMQGSLNSVVVWIPLVDIDKDLGAVEFIPKSHKLGLLNTITDEWFRRIDDEKLNENDFIGPDVKIGDVVLFSSLTIHRSGDNITDNIRWSTHFRYNDARENTFVDRGFPHPYIVYKPNQDIITPDFPTKDDLDRVF